MRMEGFTPYDPEAAKRYEKKRWWLGLTLGDMFDKTKAMSGFLKSKKPPK